MAAEHRDRHIPTTPFRVVVKPLIEGANPFVEDQEIGPTRALNHRAILEERVYLYEGEPYSIQLGGRLIRARSFVDLRIHNFPDATRVYHPVANWGLKDASTDQAIEDYSSGSASADPIYVFRIAKILEAFPELADLSVKGADFDWELHPTVAAAGAAKQTFYSWDMKNDAQNRLTRQKGEIIELIGENRLQDIIQMLPPHLDEMILEMRRREVGVLMDNLERELKLKRINPSEYFLDMLAAYYEEVGEFAKGLEDAGWI